MSGEVDYPDVEVEFKDVFYIVGLKVETITDNNYGADADGNRGTSQTFINDYSVEAIMNGAGEDVTDKFSDVDIEDIGELAMKKV